MRFLAPSLAATLLLAPGLAGACTGLEARDSWIRVPVPGAAMTAGYARLRNTGSAPLRVDGGRSAAFGAVMLHRTVVENGLSRMRHESLALAPGAAAALEPGGWHLMLMNPRRELRPGDTVAVALTCGDRAQEIIFTVKASP